MPKLRNRQQKLSDLLRVILRMFSLKRKNISSACTSGEKVCHRWYEDLECDVIIGDVSWVFVYDKKSLKKKWSKLDANVVGSWPCVHPFSFTRITSALNLSFCYAVRFRDKIRRTQRPGGAQYENISVKTAQNFYFFFLVSALVFKIKLKEFQFQRSEQAGNQVFIDSEPERPLLCLYF